jgi:hypothetical protein
MYGEASLGELALAEAPDVGVPIIPEVAVETKTLVFAIEIDLLLPGET